MPLPEPGSDFVRFAVFAKRPHKHTPGSVARQTGLDPDLIGPIAIEADCILVDVHKNCKKAARERLGELGGCKILTDRELQWKWLRLGLGRNHGLTMRKLKHVLEDAEAQPVGRIHLNNNYTVVGLREDRWETVLAALGERQVNGIALAPREATRGEHRGEDPRFYNRDERDRR